MNLLPKTHKNFSQKEYWESFFKKRGKKAFDWYGEYLELCSYLHEKIGKNDSILMVGCGNSSLSTDMYDSGFIKITNIDISNVAIKQQEKINSKKRPEMKYIVMDALDMKFDDNAFSVVIDKGTLDALMSDDSSESVERADKLFNQIVRVMNDNGKYICVSLLQEHILKKLLTFYAERKFNVKIERCIEAEQKTSEKGEMAMPVFIITCTNNKKNKSMIEFCMYDTVTKYRSVDEVVSVISTMQQSSQVINSLGRTNLGDQEEIFFDLYKPGEDTNPRYTIYVLDKPYKNKKDGEYAAFIVPQGRETEWIFSSKEGRRKFLDISGNARLAIVTLNRGHVFESLDQIKNELNEHVKNLAPPGLKSRINYLSCGNDIGERVVKFRGESELSGPFIIEDCKTDNGDVHRRLIFLNNQHIIQSEAKLKTVKGRRGKSKLVVDSTYVMCSHHVYMSIGVHTAGVERDVIVIGLGGGSLCQLLRVYLPEIKVTAVDIDPMMLKVATEWFGLVQDDKMVVHIEDGLKYMDDTVKKGLKFKAVLFDVDSKDASIGMSCPPKSFLEPTVLDNVLKLIGNDGVFVLNLVLRNESLYEGIVCVLKSKFKTVVSYKLSEDLNEIFYCYPYETDKKQQYSRLIAAFVQVAQLEKQNKLQKLELDLKETWKQMNAH